MITEESLQESLQKFDEKMADLTQRFGDLEDEMLRHKDVKQEKQADDVNLDASKQHNALKSNVPLAALWNRVLGSSSTLGKSCKQMATWRVKEGFHVFSFSMCHQN